MESLDEQSEILRLLKENTVLAHDNNELLKKIHRWNIVGMSLKSIWFVFIIGFPFLFYFYIVQPYFSALGSDYQVFKAGINEIPGLKVLEHLFTKVGK